MAYCKEFLTQTHGANSTSFDSFWARLWKLYILLKVLHFVWPVTSGILATKVALSRRVSLDPYCPFCSNRIESAYRVLF